MSAKRWAAAVVAVVSVLVLAGWAFDATLLKSVLATRASMKPNSAIAFLLASGALALRDSGRRSMERVASGLALLCSAIGAATLIEYALGVDLRIDQLLFTDVPGPHTPVPGRMALSTAFNFTVLGVALLWFGDQRTSWQRNVTELLVSVAMVVAVFGLIAHLYGVPAVTMITAESTQMAVHTAALFLVLATAVIAMVPGGWIVGAVVGDTVGSISARRLLPIVISVAVTAGYLVVQVIRRGGADLELTVAVLVSVGSVLLAFAVLVNGRRMNALDTERRRSAQALLESERLREAQHALEKSEARYQTLFHSMLNGLAYCRLLYEDGEPVDVLYLDVNPAFERLAGITGFVGRRGNDVVPGIRTSNPELLAFYSRVARTGQPDHLETFVKPLGTWLSVTAYSPDTDHIVVVAENVTDRRAHEAALRDSEARFRAMFEQAAVGIGRVAPDGQFLEVNDRLCSIVGWNRDELLARSFQDITHVDDRAGEQSLADRVLAGEIDSYVLEKRYVNPHGEPVWANITKSAVRDDEGQPRYFVAIIEGIGRRKQVEEELRLSRERLELAQEAGRSGTFDWDIQRNVNTWSPQIEALYGVPPGGFGGTFEAWQALVFPDDLPMAKAAVEASLQTGEFQGEWRVHRQSDGQVRWIGGRARVFFDATGRAARMIGINTDITERKRVEEELKRSNGELERFAYVASHDLQEPLRTVSSYVQLLARRYRDQLDADAHEFIDYAVKGATRMQQLIEALLAFSRIGSRGGALISTSAAEALDSVLQSLDTTIAETGAVVTHDALPDVVADPIQLAQVFSNLISNAIKFRGDRRPTVHVGVGRYNGSWLFSVRDNGIGIDARYFERIFVIFQRLHGREEYPGTGIGLAIAKKIVERHGGRLWVESAPGAGSTFWFTLPAVGTGGGATVSAGVAPQESLAVVWSKE